MAKQQTNRSIIEGLAKTNPTWCARIPEAARDNFDQISVIIQAPDSTMLRSEIYDDLLSRIGKTAFVENATRNPLERFKNGAFRYGDVYQEIGIDILEEFQFEGVTPKGTPAADQFENFQSTVEADYHRINRRAFYPYTMPDVRLRTAFLNEGGLYQLLSGQLAAMDKSNTTDEFIYTKRALHEFFINKVRPLRPMQKLQVPDFTSSEVTPKQIELFNETVQLRVNQMTFNSREFNAHGFMASVSASDMVMLIDYRYGVRNNMRYLSNIFNPELTRIQIPVIPLDDFGDGDDNKNPDRIVGVVCDRRFIQVYNTLVQMTTAFNARALSTNYFLHVQQLYAASAFMPVVYLTVPRK